MDAGGTTSSGEESRGEEAEAWALALCLHPLTLPSAQSSAPLMGAGSGIPPQTSFDDRAMPLNRMCKPLAYPMFVLLSSAL